MKDILGSEIKIGSLVLACNTTIAIKPKSFGLLVGENQVFKCDEKGNKKVYTYNNILVISVDTDEKRKIYDSLVEDYNSYQYKEYTLLSNYSYHVSIGDVLKIKGRSKLVYFGYCSVKTIHNGLDDSVKEGYLYVSYRFISDLKDELNRKSKNITYKIILKRLFLGTYGSDYYVISSRPLDYLEKTRPFEILGRIGNYIFDGFYRYEIDYDSYKFINFILDDDEDELDEGSV